MWEYDADRPDVWTWLRAWYVTQCDGDWEHQYGVEIETLDNPGWTVTIDLAETTLESKSFDRVAIHRSEDDWSVCRVEERRFRGACGPVNLGEVLHTFRAWVSSADETTD